LTNSGLDNEKELFRLIAAGDEKAFERLYDLVKPKMIGYVIKLMKTEVAVMEVVQESMVRVWLNRDKLPDIEYPISWLFKIVANECFRYFRKNGLQQQVKQELQKLSTDVSDVTERELSYRETQRIIQDVVLSLPGRQREIYRLSRIEGLNMHEIAAQTGLSYRYVKKVLMAALKIIRQKLVETGRYNMPLLITALAFVK
jgi:RNA polymerase sigma-70 factor (ECF subfamily)